MENTNRVRDLQPHEAELVRLLWDYLRRDPEHKDRRLTTWGSKTQVGLVNTIAFIMDQAPKLQAK